MVGLYDLTIIYVSGPGIPSVNGERFTTTDLFGILIFSISRTPRMGTVAMMKKNGLFQTSSFHFEFLFFGVRG